MDLISSYGDAKLSNVSVEDLIRYRLGDAEGGQVEQLHSQVQMLSEMVARLIKRQATDEEALEIIGLSWKWGVRP